jgi:hypothetical protein
LKDDILKKIYHSIIDSDHGKMLLVILFCRISLVIAGLGLSSEVLKDISNV